MTIRKLAVLTFCCTVATHATADDNFWFGAKAGTLGLGVEATWAPLPYMDIRAGVNGFTLDADGEEAGVEYVGDVDLRSFYATANLRVPLSPLRFTAGIFNNGNEIALRSVDSQTFDIGSQTFTAAEVGTLNADVDFDSVSPYVGVGLDFRLADTIGLNIDAGVLRQGSPNVSLAATGPIASDAAFQAELEAERVELQEEVDDFDLYPVVSVGISWNF